MRNREIKKLIERFVGLYNIREYSGVGVTSINEDLPSSRYE